MSSRAERNRLVEANLPWSATSLQTPMLGLPISPAKSSPPSARSPS